MKWRVPSKDYALQNGALRDELLGALERVLLEEDPILGEELGRFEREFAEYLRVPHVVGVGSGTDALVLALRAGSGEGVQSSFPFLFFLLFISSMNLPRNLIEVDWFRVAAGLNPVSYMIEGMRSLVIEGWNGQALALAFGFAFAMTIAGMTTAALALRTRMART